MIALSWAKSAGKFALDFVLPPRCVCCGSSSAGVFLCKSCEAELKVATGDRCSRCWSPGALGLCRSCATQPPAFDSLSAAFEYSGLTRELVHAFKYRSMTALGDSMAKLVAPLVYRQAASFDCLVPVPLHWLRERQRGFNQAEVLANRLGRRLRLPVESRALERWRNTARQALIIDPAERKRNVAGAFRSRKRLRSGPRVLLIDDVTTTGATLEECAAALKMAGAARVGAFCFARSD